MVNIKRNTTLLPVDILIEKAVEAGVDFGKSDPYNRLRYYTKLGWLPNMVRKKTSEGDIRGHYPLDTIKKLLTIQDLKSQGMTNDDITQHLSKTSEKNVHLKNILKAQKKKYIWTSILGIVILGIILTELGVIKIGQNKSQIIYEVTQQTQLDTILLESGTAFIPQNETSVFVSTANVNTNSRINITFTDNYEPAARYWVSEIMPGSGFRVTLDAPVENSAEFNWWISN